MFKSKSIKSFTAGLVLASGLFMSSGTGMAAKDFTDLYDDMSHSNSVLLLNGMDAYDYKQGTKLNGSAAVTRGEVSQILHNICKNYWVEKRPYSNNFKDVNSNTKYYDAIVWSYEAGIFDGSNGKFNPDQTLTRAQMAKILVTLFNLKSDSKQSFKDTQSHWASDYIGTLSVLGYANGTGNRMFSPEAKVTLNQLSTFLYRLLMDGKEPFKEYIYLDGVKTYDEVYSIALDLYDSIPYTDKEVVVKTAEDFSEKFVYDTTISDNFSEDSKIYSYGRDISMYTEKISDSLYETRLVLSYEGGAEKGSQSIKKYAKAVEYIKANYNVSTDYKKVEAVNEFLADQMTYGVAIEGHEFLEDGQSLCANYAASQVALLKALGLEARLVTGVEKSDNPVGHEWAAVNLGGEWYYTDATTYDSDNGKNYNKYLLMTQSELDTYITEIDSDFRATNTPYDNK